ncbi:hypothetical protein KFE25_006873 [Diacronema lutheri]|uniref:Essential protein Yae1 N-terminal domain-containing protein n=1 Tax=Diacronema lutheri TaxID=2081491 RepID=A0A8J5XRP9_DIALT|nr:hypothetical protein KFE25_006873 [Diacronema lutheri]
MDDWLEEEEGHAPGAERERAERELEYGRLARRLGALGFSDGADAGHEAVLQASFDRGYREGFASAHADAVRMTSELATFAEFYARHGSALGMPISLSALVFADAHKLARDDIARRLASLLAGNGTPADAGAPDRWARLFGWEDVRAEFTKRQFDVAVDATIRTAGPSLGAGKDVHDEMMAV